jgi:hypothetical protein
VLRGKLLERFAQVVVCQEGETVETGARDLISEEVTIFRGYRIARLQLAFTARFQR